MNKSIVSVCYPGGDVDAETTVNTMDIASGIPATVLEQLSPNSFDTSSQWVYVDNKRVTIGSEIDIEWSTDPIAVFYRRGDDFETWRIYKKIEDCYDFYREVEGSVTVEWSIDKIELMSRINHWIAEEEEIQSGLIDSDDDDNYADWTNFNLMNDCLDDLVDN